MVHRSKRGFGAGGVRQEIEHGEMLDRPTDGGLDCLQKLIWIPPIGANDRDITDGTHRNLDEA